MSDKYDRTQLCNFSLASMTKNYNTMVWVDGHQASEDVDDDDIDEEEIPMLPKEPCMSQSD